MGFLGQDWKYRTALPLTLLSRPRPIAREAGKCSQALNLEKKKWFSKQECDFQSR